MPIELSTVQILISYSFRHSRLLKNLICFNVFTLNPDFTYVSAVT